MWYAVQGRVPNDDEDALIVFEAENRDEAVRKFAAELWSNQNIDDETVEEFDARWGSDGGVYVTSVVESNTEIRYA